MASALEYAGTNAERFLAQLEDLTRIPSVSTDPAFAGEIRRAAEWLADDMRRIGLEGVEISPTEGHPVVYAEWLGAGTGAPTVLLYAHYDVQPAAREDGWDSEPFEPTRRDGRVFARGVGDDKLHTVMILKVAESLLNAEQGCPVNLRIVLEGEEEMGSRNFAPWVRANRERLSADYCLVCDSGIETPDTPIIHYALRGMLAMEFAVHGPKADLHSGLHGGRVHNPAQAVAEMVAKLHAEDGSIAVPGFYEDVRGLAAEERAEMAKGGMSRDEFDAVIGAPEPWGEPGFTLEERATARPTLEINGIYGGYTGEGIKTVIPSRASAKITCRLVTDQKPERIYEQIEAYLREIAPPTVRLEVEMQGRADPVIVPMESPLVQAYARSMRKEWSRPPQYRRMGASIPITPVIQSELGTPTLIVGFNVLNGGFHGPNEFIHIDLFHRGTRTLIHLLEDLGGR